MGGQRICIQAWKEDALSAVRSVWVKGKREKEKKRERGKGGERD